MNSVTDLFWRRSQSRELSDAWDKQRDATRHSELVSADCRHLEHQVDRLLLISRALWEILAQTQGVKEEDLVAKMKEIDLRDGHLDGKQSSLPMDCPVCHHRLHPRNHWCLYCGAKIETADPFIE